MKTVKFNHEKSLDSYNSPTKSHSMSSLGDHDFQLTTLDPIFNASDKSKKEIPATKNQITDEKLLQVLKSITSCTNLTDISSMDSDDRLGEIRGLLIQLECLAK